MKDHDTIKKTTMHIKKSTALAKRLCNQECLR